MGDRLATIDMGRKVRACCALSVPSGILIHLLASTCQFLLPQHGQSVFLSKERL